MPAGALGFGALLFPAAVLGMLLRSKGPLDPFLQARAFTPETARRPSSLAVTNAHALRTAERAGILIPAGDGRYYIDIARYRRRRFALLAVLAAILIVAVVGYFSFIAR